MDILEPLIVESGGVDFAHYSFDEGPIHSKPLVRCGDVIIVPEPSALLVAPRHRILCMAEEDAILQQVADTYREAVWDHVQQLLGRYWRYEPANINLPGSAVPIVKEAIFVLDADKALYVQLVTDPLDDFSPESVFGTWNANSINKTISNRQNEVVSYLTQQASHPDKILILTVTAGLGRYAVLGLSEPPDVSLVLLMKVADLTAITFVDAADPLALWKFARSAQIVRRKVEIVTTDLMDEYELYRARNCSYYVSDERLPTMIVIAPGMGSKLRVDAYHEFDLHGISSFHDNRVAEVWLLQGHGMPVYAPPAMIGVRPSVVVDGPFSLPIWVVGSKTLEGPLYAVGAQIAETIAYWLWQFVSFLRGPMSFLPDSVRRFCIHFDLADRKLWSEMVANVSEGSADARGPLFDVTDSDQGKGELCISLNPSLLDVIGTSDNSGERRLIHALLQSLRDLLGSINPKISTMMSDDEIDSAIEEHAPLGQ